MRLSRILFAAKWLSVVVCLLLALVAIRATTMKGRLIDDHAMARWRPVESQPTGAEARASESMARQSINLFRDEESRRLIKLIHDQESAIEVNAANALAKERELTSYSGIARHHSEQVEQLDSLLHSGGEFNGKMTFVLFTDDYYRDPEKHRRRWLAKRDWHARMAEKYRYAALYLCESVPPDPPEPE
jgi:hypothetical protein